MNGELFEEDLRAISQQLLGDLLVLTPPRFYLL